MDASELQQSTLDSFSTIERSCSVFSLLGCLIIIGSFAASKSFHKPINRLVFYASFGNMMSNVATLMARSFLANVSSGPCVLQAFLVQMFMPADAFWTLAMAFNVYLTFYHKFDGQRLRRMEPIYLGLCYGIPFVVALVFVFVKSSANGPMYGNALLWCWVSNGWDIFRIATFYGPVWVVIVITFGIYVRAGREIYKRHRQLQYFGTSTGHDEPPQPSEDPFANGGSKTTEISVTTEVVGDDIDLAPLGGRRGGKDEPQGHGNAYSVTISSANKALGESGVDSLPIQGRPETAAQLTKTTTQTQQTQQTQQPSAAAAAQANRMRRRANLESNRAAWSYAKCALLFFTAMLVTWIPSSANRVFSVIYPGKVSVPLEFMSAFVLPLQGFWNATVYIVTSWRAFKELWEDTRGFFADRFGQGSSSPSTTVTGRRPNEVFGGFRPGNDNFQKMGSSRSGKSDHTYESESMTELAAQPGRRQSQAS